MPSNSFGPISDRFRVVCRLVTGMGRFHFEQRTQSAAVPQRPRRWIRYQSVYYDYPKNVGLLHIYGALRGEFPHHHCPQQP